MRSLTRLLLAGASLAALTFTARADLTVLDGNAVSQVIFDFTCFTTKHCTAHVNVNSAGTENFTTAAPGIVSGSGTAGTAATGVLTVQGITSMTPLLATLSAETTKVIGTVNLSAAQTLATLTTITNPVAVTGTFWQATQPVVGAAATGATLSGNPVRVGLSDGTNAQNWLAGIALVDGVNGNNAGAVANYVWNGTTWDRLPGTTAGVKITAASGAFAANSQVDFLTTRQTMAAGAAAANSQAVGGQYNSSPITLTNTQGSAIQLDANGYTKVNCTVGCSGSSFNNNADNVATSSTSGQTAAWNYVWDGSAWDRLYGDSTNGSFVNVKTSSSTQTMVAGTAAANSWAVGGQYNSTPITLTNTQGSAHQLDANGYLKVNVAAGGAAGGTSSTFGAAFPTAGSGTAAGFYDGTNMAPARVGDVNNATAATNYQDVLAIGRYNTTQPTLTDTRYNALQVSARGELLVANGVSGLAVNATIVGGLLSAGQAAMASSAPVTLADNQTVPDPCMFSAKTSFPISQATSTQLFAGTASVKTYICSIALVGADAENVSLVAGTGTVCATGTAAVIGGTTAATGPNLAANGGFTLGNGGGTVAAGITNADNICLLQSASGRVAGVLTYVKR